MTLSFSINVRSSDVRAVDVGKGAFELSLALEVPPGVTVLFGPSGAGKSLTLAALAGLVASRGRIVLAGRTLQDERASLRPHERRIGLVPQDGLLFPHLSVRSNLRYGAPRGQDPRELAEVVSVLDLGPLLDRSPGGLSGGERQRVALGRALLAAPDALLLDEPLAALDRERRAQIVPYLRRAKERLRVPVLYVTHALDEALALGDRACVIAAGKKVAEGRPLEVFGAPRAELVPRLSGFENVLAVSVDSQAPDRSVTHARAGDARLVLPFLDAAPETQVFVGLGASEIVLAMEKPHAISAQNVLPATVAELIPGPRGVDVRLDLGGATLVARVVASTVGALGLAPGAKVFAIVKATSFQHL